MWEGVAEFTSVGNQGLPGLIFVNCAQGAAKASRLPGAAGGGGAGGGAGGRMEAAADTSRSAITDIHR